MHKKMLNLYIEVVEQANAEISHAFHAVNSAERTGWKKRRRHTKSV